MNNSFFVVFGDGNAGTDDDVTEDIGSLAVGNGGNSKVQSKSNGESSTSVVVCVVACASSKFTAAGAASSRNESLTE